MDCRVVHTIQGGDDGQWDELRLRRITASRVADVMAKPDSKRHLKYRHQLTMELLGHSEQEESPEWFRHGREMEPRGLARYAWKYDEELDHDVFLIHKDYDWMAASPDSLQMTNGRYKQGLEMKCRKLYKEYKEAVARQKKFAESDRLKMIEPGYRFQVQTCMWLTGFDHWWYVNYYEVKNQHGFPTGDYKLTRCPVPRDQKLIDEIKEACILFYAECVKSAGLA